LGRRIEGYTFKWAKCHHQLGFRSALKELEYKEKVRDYQTIPIPDCSDLSPKKFEERGILPKDRTPRIVAILLTLLFVLLLLTFIWKFVEGLL
jgi:hypothetical protein